MPPQKYSLALVELRFPRTLPKKRSNFRLVVSIRSFTDRHRPNSESLVMPGLEDFWECDPDRRSRQNFVRGDDDGDFGVVDLAIIDPWERSVLFSAGDVRALRVTLYDVDRTGLWEKILDRFKSVVEAVTGKAAELLPETFGFSSAVEDLLVEKLTAGDASADRLLFRQTWARKGSDPLPETLEFAGPGFPWKKRGVLREYRIRLSLEAI